MSYNQELSTDPSRSITGAVARRACLIFFGGRGGRRRASLSSALVGFVRSFLQPNRSRFREGQGLGENVEGFSQEKSRLRGAHGPFHAFSAF